MKIIVVEDSEEFQKVIRTIIRKVLFKIEKEAEVFMYKKFDNELSKIIKDVTQKKLYLLDIELGEKVTGIDIAQFIRKEDWESEIIFLTNHDKMFEKVYRSLYKVFDFIEKFDKLNQRLEKDLTIILDKKHDTSVFSYSNRKISLQLYKKDITYITRDKKTRKVIISTTNNKFLLNLPISKMLARLDERFVMVHRCCIVNTERIQKYSWADGYFLVDTGEKVAMLSHYYKEKIQEIEKTNNF